MYDCPSRSATGVVVRSDALFLRLTLSCEPGQVVAMLDKDTRTSGRYMSAAFELAETAATRGEVPVGAVVVDGVNGDVLACAHNRIEELGDPTAHAEILALREAARVKRTPRLIECDLYVTLEPCTMCAGAISLARIRRLYFGASDRKGGGIEHGARVFGQPTCHHAPEVYGGIDAQRSEELLRKFFSKLRRTAED
jgi:tRNA(adenine34) deaminase